MPRTVTTIAELDAEAARIDALAVDGKFRRVDDGNLLVGIEAERTDAGTLMFALSVAEVEPGRSRAGSGEPWRNRARKLGTAIRAFAKQFPAAEVPPARLRVRCRGRGVNATTFEGLLRGAFAEALGKTPAEKPSKTAKTKPPEEDWIAALRSGTEGARRWNRLKAAERKSIDLGGADLREADLASINFRGVQAKGAALARCTLRDAAIGGACLDRADLSSADLRGANLKGVDASRAVFREAMLERAILTHGMLFGASFNRADLTGADLADANLHGADFTDARLDSVRLDGASIDAKTCWPDGFTIPAEVVFDGKGTDPRLKGKGKNAVAVDINGLMARLQGLIDPKRLKRTLDMLKSGRHQLFAEVEGDHVRGIVRSQTSDHLVYSCVLTETGIYACCTPDLEPCMGLYGEPCKHLLVLIIGLAKAGALQPATIDRWLLAIGGKRHRWNKVTKNHVSETLLRYKGFEAGEVDWRPTETIPEDYYAL